MFDKIARAFVVLEEFAYFLNNTMLFLEFPPRNRGSRAVHYHVLHGVLDAHAVSGAA